MNFFSDLPRIQNSEEVIEIFAECSSFYIERIISCNSISPPTGWYEQPQDEWVMVIQGEAEIQTELECHRLSCFDTLFIPANTKHKVTYTSSAPNCIWLAIHSKKISQ